MSLRRYTAWTPASLTVGGTPFYSPVCPGVLVSRIARTTAALALAVAASALALAPANAAPVGPAGLAPATGASSAKSTFETGGVCKASDTVSVLVSGGTGTGAAVPAPGKAIVKPVPVASVSTPGGGMSIPSTQTWEAWATTGDPVLSRIDGDYAITVQCTNGESYAGTVRFTGTNVTDATYTLVVPTPTTATATATTTATATATATETKTATATATTTAPEKPRTLPPTPPTSNGVLAVVGAPIAGATITVAGEGFRPGSPITVGIYSDPKELASAVADGDGKASTQLVLPKDRTGKHTLVMLGYAPDGNQRTVSAEVTVIDAPVVTIPPELPKSDGALTVSGVTVAGGTITVTGDGYKPGSPISVGIYSTGKPLASAVADANGKATTDLVIPADYTGTHTLAMIGSTSKDTLRTLTSEVSVAAAPVPSSGVPWWVWLIVAIVVIAIIAAIIAASRRKKSTPWDDALSTQAAAAQQIADGPALAISDRGRDAAAAITLWNTDLPAIQSTEAQINQLVQTAPDETRSATAQRLLGSTVALREALNADVQLRANESAPGQDALLTQSAGVIAQRRQELSAVVASIPPVTPPTGAQHR